MSSSESEYEDESSENDSSSESEDNPNPKTRRKTAGIEKEHVDPFNDYICLSCNKGFRTISKVKSHVQRCELTLKRKKEQQLTCRWCKLTFTNRGGLANHAFRLHSDISYRSFYRPTTRPIEELRYECRICKQAFYTKSKLTFHIRLLHFNLKGRAPYADLKKVNQVWYEKVKNSNNIIEIRKASNNMLVMKKIDENTAVKVNNDNERIIDVSHIYPVKQTQCNVKVRCNYCNKLLNKKVFNVHIREVHLNVRIHHCNNCNKRFTRRNRFIKHVCRTSMAAMEWNSDILTTGVKQLLTE